ncbi:MAG: hypothetical protein A2514_15700 [Gammaproteobacteria bacterium RIFOXYD12_FULL_61_37]|nr:MAG: hypothetical protein A2514_15700 [Gammaproteobacteria bacterium RIFOXYD12_FULL_61_37]
MESHILILGKIDLRGIARRYREVRQILRYTSIHEVLDSNSRECAKAQAPVQIDADNLAEICQAKRI